MSGDPRDDSRAQALLSADPGLVNSLVIMFQGVAQQAQDTSDGLRGVEGKVTWTGGAADAFDVRVGKLPGDLGKVTSSYQEAADALNGYESQVSILKSGFQNVASQLASANAQLAGSQAQLASAQATLALAKATKEIVALSPFSPSPFPAPIPSGSPLITAVNGANGAVQNAQGDIATLSSLGFKLLDEFDNSRTTAKGRVAGASKVPPQASFWDRAWHDIGNWAIDTGHFLAAVGKGIFDSVGGTVGAFQNFVNHPTLANFGKLASDVAVDASIVVLAAAAPEAFGLVAAAEATAEATAEGAAEEGVGFAARLAAMGAPAQDVATVAGSANADAELLQGHFANYGVDAAFAYLPGGDDLSSALGVGEKTVEETVSNAGAMETYQFFTDHGFTPGEAMSLMTDDEVHSVLHDVTNLDDRAEVASATQNATQAAQKAAKNAARIGAPVAFSADSIKDKLGERTQEKLGELLHPPTTPPNACTCP